MEEQSRLPLYHSDPSTQATSARVSPESLTPASTPTLRFPKPQGSRRLASWISSSSPDIMQPSNIDDDHSLADSASYELISSTDGESQDGRLTESIADSLDMYPRADDVQSLSGNDNTYENDSESEVGYAEPQSGPDFLRFAEEILDNPSAQSPSTPEEDNVPEATGTPLVQSIEFNEADGPVYLEKISVRHATREFSEEETSTIAEDMHMKNPPKRLVATIRQTMSHHCLSTREPLRILYVGSEAGYQDIMYKISSALLASAPSASAIHGSGSDSEGIFNIVPISSFGSSKIPETDEIQLMNVSDYYIKVERCTSANETVYEGESFPGDTMYSITIDNDKTYTSVFCPSGSVVQPKWLLPHVAVFYLSGNDDEEAETTRNAAWEFMTRHAIPSIFISHAQSFEKSSSGRWRDFVDQAAVHLCLESRDPERPIPLERVPIDLTSFLNIDARQMNRNLAYLTGLHEPLTLLNETDDDKKDPPRDRLLKMLPHLSQDVQELGQTIQSLNWKTFAFAIISTILGIYLGTYLPQMFAGNQKTLSTVPAASIASVPTISSTCLVPTTTPTVTINLTSTKTIKLSPEEPTNLAAQFGGFLSDRAQAIVVEPEAKKTTCSIEIYSSTEILVKVPSGTKTTWLAKGAIDIDVWRGKELLKSKLSTIDDGILIEISKKDAYGVMNVSVVTTRRPKINETFAVNFGKPAIVEAFEAGASLLQNMATKLVGVAEDTARVFEDSYVPALASVADRVRDDVASISGHIKEAGKAAQDFSSRATEEVVNRAKGSVSTAGLNKLLKDTQDKLASHLQSTEHLRDGLDLSVLRAQIASKLLWLKIQGKTVEHAEYEAKASEFVKQKERDVEVKHLSKAKAECGKSRSWRRSCGLFKAGGHKGKWKVLG